MSLDPMSGPRDSESADRKSRRRPDRKSYLARRARRSAFSHLTQPCFEVLEARTLLSTINWVNTSGGDWDTASNWSGGLLPGAGDDVVIGVPNNVVITHAQNVTDTVHSVTASDPISLSKGTLNVTSTLGSTSTLALAGGTLSNATIQSGTTLTGSSSGSTLDGVAIGTGATLTMAAGQSVSVLHDLTVDGAVNFTGQTSFLRFNSAVQTVGGTGVIFSSSTGGTAPGLLTGSGVTTLTLGAGLTIHGSSLYIGPDSGGGVNTGSVENHATIAGDGTGTLTIGGGKSTANPVGFTNAAGGKVQLTSAAEILNISPSNWTNQGTVELDAGTLNLGGSFTTADIGTWDRTGGTMNLTGTLTNTGAALRLDGAAGGLGTWVLAGEIIDGTVDTSNGAVLQGGGGTLDGVAIGTNGTLLMPAGQNVSVLRGLTVDGAVDFVGSTSFLRFNGASQTVGGTGEIFSSSTGGTAPGLLTEVDGTTLTLGAGLRIHGSGMYIGPDGGVAPRSVVNHATITADGTGTLTIGGVSSPTNPIGFTNAAGGKVQLTSAAEILNISPSNWTNQGTVELDAGTLNLGGSFTTADIGTWDRTGGTMNLTGTLTNTGAALRLDGAAGGLGTWVLAGKIIDGTVNTSNGAVLQGDGGTLDGVAIGTNGTLLMPAGQNVSVLRGLTVDGAVDFTGQTSFLRFNGASQTVGGTGEVFSSSSGGTAPGLLTEVDGTTLTLGVGLRIHGSSMYIGPDSGGSSPIGSVVNHATITGDGSGTLTIGGMSSPTNPVGFTNAAGGKVQLTSAAEILNISPSNWINQGTIQLDAGTLNLGGTWSNQGIIQTTGGTLNLAGSWDNIGGSFNEASTTVNMGGTFTQFGLGAAVPAPGQGTFTRSGGTINLTGTVTGGLTLDDALGSWNFKGGTVKDGTFRIVAGSSATLIATNTPSFLDNATLASPLDLKTPPNPLIHVLNALTVNTSQQVGSVDNSVAATIDFDGDVTVGTAGGGEFVLGASLSNTLADTLTTGAITLGPGFTIRGVAGSVGNGNGPILNQGTIRAEGGAGTSLDVRIGNGGRNDGLIAAVGGSSMRIFSNVSQPWTNAGTISVAGGGSLQMGIQPGEAWLNLGTIALTGSTLLLRGDLTQARVGQIARDATSTVRIDTSSTITGDLHLDDTTGNWLLGGGTLQDGTLYTSGSARLIGAAVPGGESTLQDETIDGNLDLTTSNTTIYVSGGLTINTVLNVGDSAGTFNTNFNIRDDQTWSGTGSIVFGGSLNNAILSGVTKSLTIDSGLRVHGKSATISQLSSFVVRGTLADDVNGGAIEVGTASFTNQGTVGASGGGEVRIHPTTTFTNYTGVTQTGPVYSGTLDGGRWTVGAGSALRFSKDGSSIERFARLDADLGLDGGGSNVFGGQASTSFATADALATLTSIGGDGRLSLTGGRTIAPGGSFTNEGSLVVGAGSVFGTAAPTGATPPTPSSSYLAEGNANDAQNVNNGSAVGGLTYVPGLFDQGRAFNFDGASAGVDLGTWFNLPTYSIGFWVKPAGTQATNATILDNNTAVGSSSNWTIEQNGNQTNQYFWRAEGIAISFSLQPGLWQYVVVTRDTNKVNLVYVNGVPSTPANGTGTLYTAPHLLVGQAADGTRHWAGSVDDLQFYKTALTAADVTNTYRGESQTAYTQTGGSTTVDGTLRGLNLAGGTLYGRGTIDGSVANTGGIVAPGDSPGFLDITGDYTQGPAGTLDLQIAGRDPDVPQYDRLRITGDAHIDGTLHLDLLGGFEPAPGDVFQVLTSALLTGQFARLEVPAPGGAGRRLATIYDARNVSFVVQDVPPLNFVATTTGAGADGAAADDEFHPAHVKLDAAGDVYAIGDFTGTVNFDREHNPSGVGTTLTSPPGHVDGIVAKYSPSGVLLWIRSVDSATSAAQTGGFVIDDQGDSNPANDVIDLAGFWATSVVFSGGGGTLSNAGQTDTYLIQIDPNGNAVGPLRSFQASVGGHAVPDSLALAPNHDLIVGGDFDGTVDFDPSAGTANLTSSAAYPVDDHFVVELTPSFTYVRGGQISGNSNNTKVAVGPDGSVWFAGNFTGTTTGLATLTSAGDNDIFLLKLAPNGAGFTPVVTRSYGGPGYDQPYTLTTDPQGDVVMGGQYQFGVNFDPTPGHAFTLVSSGDRDAFVVKLDPQGNFVFARSIGGYLADSVNEVDTDPLGNVYATGWFTDRVNFDPEGSGGAILEASPTSIQQGYLLKLDPAGNFDWVAQLGDVTGGQVHGLSVDADGAGRIAETGWFRNTADFDPTDGVALRTFTPGGDPVGSQALGGFLALYTQKAVPQAAFVGLPAAALTQGATLALGTNVVDADSISFTYSWSLSRNSVAYASGTGAAFSARLADPGVYGLALTVTDESGNSSTTTGTVVVDNAAPSINATTYASAPTTTANPGFAAGDHFGTAVATAGNLLLVGAPGKTIAGHAAAGQAALYDATTGALLRTLIEPSPVANDQFGSSVALAGSYAIVGAPNAGVGGLVFVFDTATGNPLGIFAGPSPAAGDKFGAAVAAFGNLAIVGAPGRSAAAGAGVGEAYLLDPSTGRIVQTYRNPTPGAGDGFGTAVAGAGSLVLVGAPGDDGAGLDAGAAYAFDPNGGALTASLLNPNPGFSGSGFGGVLATSGTRGLVGAPLDRSSGTTDAGSVSLYDLDPNSATFGQLLRTVRGPDAGAGHFGIALAFAGDRAVVGADADGGSGSSFLIDLDASSATYGSSIAAFKKTTPVAGDRFGGAVALVGTDVLVAAPQDGTAAAGAGALYRFAATGSIAVTPASINENDVVNLAASFSDPGTSDAHTAVVDWGDGGPLTTVTLAAGATQLATTHRYLNNNPVGDVTSTLHIRLKVLDATPDLVAVGPGLNQVARFDGTSGAAEGAFASAGLSAPSAVAVGPEGDLYVAGGTTGANPILKYDGATGLSLGTFVLAGAAGNDPASGLTFSPGGDLFIADATGNRVFRASRTTGAVSLFIGAGAGGLSGPRGLAFGPDGALYVASSQTDSILRFDGQTGAFLSTFIPATAGLHGPAGLAFTPAGDLFVLSLGGAGASILRFDAATGDPLGDFAYPAVVGAAGGSLWLGHDGSLYAGFTGGPTYRYDAETGDSEGLVATATAASIAGLAPQSQATFNLTVKDVAPTATVHPVANPTGVLASAYTLTAAVADPGTLDTHTYLWTISGTGASILQGANTPTVSFNATTAALLTLTVTDDDLLSTTSTIQVIVGTPGNDTITVKNNQYTINGVTSTLPGTVNKVIVYGGAGDDNIDGSAVTSLPLELVGGFGNDTLAGGSLNDVLTGNSPGDYALAYAGDTGNDSLTGNSGDDTLDGGLGNDTMLGGVGNDTYIEVPGSDDLLIEGTAGGGTDTIDYGLAYFGITFSLAQKGVAQAVNPAAPPASQHTVTIVGDFENLDGSAFDDALYGTGGGNQLAGGAGNDLIYGGDPLDSTPGAIGSDSLYGGSGNDTIIGAMGNDLIMGGAPNDSSIGSSGSDSIIGGYGNDTIIGGSGNDIIYGGDPLDTTPGPFNDDSIYGGYGNDTIYGGMGNDTIVAGSPNDSTPGSFGNDSIIGGLGNDTIIGGSGNDIIYGGDPLDSTPGGSNDDSIYGGMGNDTIYGGYGNDMIVAGSPGDSTPGGAGNDSIIGGFGNDTIIGGSGNDIIYGGDPLDSTPGGSNDDSIYGGMGNDTIYGGYGNDMIVAGSPGDSTPGGAGNDSIIGGFGNDTIIGGSGNDIIYGGDPLDSTPGGSNDDSIYGGYGNDTIYGGMGNDTIVAGPPGDSTPGAMGSDSIIGGSGNDTIIGGSGNDIIYGGDPLVTTPGAAGDDSLVGGGGDDSLIGGDGNDALFGGPGDDMLTSGGGLADVVDGGSGTNTIVEVSDTDMTLSPTTLVMGGITVRIYDIQRAILNGGAGDNRIDAHAFPGPVALAGRGGNDTLIGTDFADSLYGGTGNDVLVGNGGDDTLDLGPGADSADGGDGNDTYILQSGGPIQLADSSGFDSLDFSDADFGIVLDLGLSTPQLVDLHGTRLTLGGTFENVRGSSYNDIIKGNPQRNILDGGGGDDSLDGLAGDDTLQGSFPRLVFLDFLSGGGAHAYTIDERDAIQSRLGVLYSAPFSIAFTQTRPTVGEYATLFINAGQGQNNEVLVGGQASELNWRDVDATTSASIDVNGFLGHRGQPAATSANYVALTASVGAHELGHLLGLQHSDSFGPIGIDPATLLPYGVGASLLAKSAVRNEVVVGLPGSGGNRALYAFQHGPVLLGPTTQAGQAAPIPHPAPSGTIYDGGAAAATFTIDGQGRVTITPVPGAVRTVVSGVFDATSALMILTWTALPPTSSLAVSYDYDPFRPVYTGPIDASETDRHVMASPASVGSTIQDSLNMPYFGERELIKLAFADASTTLQSGDLATTSALVPASVGTSAFVLGTLPGLAVPNLLPAGAINAGKTLNVRAVGVVGAITFNTTTQHSTNDNYAIQGHQGELLTVEVLSAALQARFGNTIDAILRVYDGAGNLLDYFGSPAVNDDGFDGNSDPLLIDVPLPSDGTYYVQVDTFTSASVPDNDTGGYELFMYTTTDLSSPSPRLGGAGDTMIGGLGADVLVGSVGDDRFVGTAGEDTLLGVGQFDVVTQSGGLPPVAQADSYVADQSTTLVVAAPGVLSNDPGSDANPWTAQLVAGSGPAHGTLSLDPDGSFTYTPVAGFVGTDSFSYTTFDGTTDSDPALVTITVVPVTAGVSGTATYNGAVTLTATLTDASGGLADQVVDFTLTDGTTETSAGEAVTDGAGRATLDLPHLPANFHAGTYLGGIRADFGGPGYAGNTATATLFVAKAAASLALSGLTFTYDGTTHTAVATTNPPALAGVTISYASAGVDVPSPRDAGTYSVKASLNNPDYTAPDATGVLTILARAVTLGATAVSKTYGDPDPTLTVTISSGSIVGGDASSGSPLRASGEGVNTYPITQGNLTLGPNYTITFIPSTFTITARALTVTANNATRLYGDPNPPLTGTIVGIQNSDAITANYSTTAGPTSPVGSYPITPTLNDPNGKLANYVVTVTPGTLTITPASTNAPPQIALLASTSPGGQFAEGQTIYIAGVFSDADRRDSHRAVVDWGDGTAPTGAGLVELLGIGAFAGAHSYANGGIYTITIMLSDGSSTVTKTTRAVVAGAGIKSGVLYVIGTNNNDVVAVNPQGSTQTKVQAGFLPGNSKTFVSSQFSSIVMLLGDGDDQATIDASIAKPSLISGDGGDDRLTGGGGTNILVGGDGNDTLNGGAARDVIIGGGGKDQVVGNAGDDLLIGGSTVYDGTGAYDVDVAALQAIADEWNLPGTATYQARTNQIRNGFLVGTRTIGLGAGNVIDDLVADTLTGSAGQDWFFDGHGDKDKDRASGELSG